MSDFLVGGFSSAAITRARYLANVAQKPNRQICIRAVPPAKRAKIIEREFSTAAWRNQNHEQADARKKFAKEKRMLNAINNPESIDIGLRFAWLELVGFVILAAICGLSTLAGSFVLGLALFGGACAIVVLAGKKVVL